MWQVHAHQQSQAEARRLERRLRTSTLCVDDPHDPVMIQIDPRSDIETHIIITGRVCGLYMIFSLVIHGFYCGTHTSCIGVYFLFPVYRGNLGNMLCGITWLHS